ncbi:MAG: carboxypeptidase-like regulatory domain-containing protein [Planctomycetota bacterium]
MIRDPLPGELTVPFLRWKIPAGDFKPWGRLFVMLAMLTAVGAAARSLGKRLQDAKVHERWQSFLEADERATVIWKPLVALDGAPNLPPGATADHYESTEGYAAELIGFVEDHLHAPVAGARVRAGAHEVTADAAGRFVISGISPKFPANITMIPPGDRADLAHAIIKDPGRGFPGMASPLGIVILPKRAEAEAGAPPPGILQQTAETQILTFRFAPGASESASLAGWQRIDNITSPFAPGEKRRDFAYSRGEARLGDSYDLSAERFAPPVPKKVNVSGSLQIATAELPKGACVFLNLFDSGIITKARLNDGPPLQFEFNNIPEGDHRLIVYVPGFLPACEDISFPLPPQIQQIEAGVEQGADVDVVVDTVSGNLPRGAAVRVTAANYRKGIFAIPDSGILKLRGLPPELLRFELLIPSRVDLGTALATPPLERTGREIVRTLERGASNMKLSFHYEALPAPIRCRGVSEPHAWIYRAGARLDEPATFARANAAGEFCIWATAGARVFAARGEAPFLTLFSSGTAAEKLQFDPASTLEVRAEPKVQIELAITGPEALGRSEFLQFTDSAGVARFSNLPPNVNVLLRAATKAGDCEWPAATPPPGETRRIEMPAAPVH